LAGLFYFRNSSDVKHPRPDDISMLNDAGAMTSANNLAAISYSMHLPDTVHRAMTLGQDKGVKHDATSEPPCAALT
jgi:hypothetical protein